MNDREFEDFDTTAIIDGKTVQMRVTSYVLHGLWGAGVGPQDAAGLVEENRAMLEQIAAEHIADGQVWDNLVVITGSDLEF